MVKILEQKLQHGFEGPFVMFDITAKMKFEPDEIGKRWRLETIIIERDRFTPDDVFEDLNWSRTFNARREEVSLQVHVPILKRDLNTEPGKEEVSVKVRVVPLEGNFPSAEVTSNIIKIDV